MDIREYDITYVAKEYLIKKGWRIIAYNPPGSQGTFTIPNPLKDGTYKGQTGSLSPDIVAWKKLNGKNIFVIVESKPNYNEGDVSKMLGMFRDLARKDLFFMIVEGHCLANDIPYDRTKPKEILYCNAYSGKLSTHKSISTILVNSKKEWDIKRIDPTQDIYSVFEIKVSGRLLKY